MLWQPDAARDQPRRAGVDDDDGSAGELALFRVRSENGFELGAGLVAAVLARPNDLVDGYAITSTAQVAISTSRFLTVSRPEPRYSMNATDCAAAPWLARTVPSSWSRE